MRIFLEKKVDLQVKAKNIKFIYFLNTGVKSAKEGLVSLSPANATIHPTSFIKNKRDQKSLSKKDAIQVSYFGHRPMVPILHLLRLISLSDTLNSSSSYPNLSTITTHKKGGSDGLYQVR